MREAQSSSAFDAFATAWLRGVRPDLVARLRALSTRVRLADRQVVYAQGVAQTYLWGVLQGEVRVHVALAELEPTLGHIHHPGAWLGESELLLGLPGIVEMRAGGDTVLEKLAFARFKALANVHPELWEALARLASMNQLVAMRAANDLALRTGRERLVAAILRLSGHRGVVQGSKAIFELRVSHHDMSGLANLARPKVSEHLKGLSERRLIDLGYGCITILDVGGLEAEISN